MNYTENDSNATDRDPLLVVFRRLSPVVPLSMSFWREMVREWASNPKHYIDENGIEEGIFPIPFLKDTTLELEERATILAAIYDTYADGLELINPWAGDHKPANIMPCADAMAWQAMKSRVDDLRMHWNSHRAKVEGFLDDIVRRLRPEVQKAYKVQTSNEATESSSVAQRSNELVKALTVHSPITDRIDDAKVSSPADPVWYQDIADVAGVDRKTVQNKASDWKKKCSEIDDGCSYAIVRPFIIRQWHRKSAAFPTDYSAFCQILSARRSDSTQVST